MFLWDGCVWRVTLTFPLQCKSVSRGGQSFPNLSAESHIGAQRGNLPSQRCNKVNTQAAAPASPSRARVIKDTRSGARLLGTQVNGQNDPVCLIRAKTLCSRWHQQSSVVMETKQFLSQPLSTSLSFFLSLYVFFSSSPLRGQSDHWYSTPQGYDSCTSSFASGTKMRGGGGRTESYTHIYTKEYTHTFCRIHCNRRQTCTEIFIDLIGTIRCTLKAPSDCLFSSSDSKNISFSRWDMDHCGSLNIR